MKLVQKLKPRDQLMDDNLTGIAQEQRRRQNALSDLRTGCYAFAWPGSPIDIDGYQVCDLSQFHFGRRSDIVFHPPIVSPSLLGG